MGTQYNQGNQDRNRDRGYGNQPKQLSTEEKALKYLPDIKLLLNPDATTENIKKAIKQIEILVNTINEQREKMTTHQIRNIYKLVKGAQDGRALNLIRPRLAYISARQKDEHGKVIAKVIDLLIVEVTDVTSEELRIKKQRMLNYILESIVAYHKFYVKE